MKIALLSICTGLVILLALTISPALAVQGSPVQTRYSPPPQTLREKQTVKRFQKQVRQYVSLRERLVKKLPGVSHEAKAEEIEAHRKAFGDIVRNARANAKPADIFRPDVAAYIRNTVKREFKGTDRKEVRETILEAQTKGVPLRVNYAYPDSKELSQVPPTLLLKLPQLPKQVKYRFVGRHLLLVDRENDLIIDYMMNALP